METMYFEEQQGSKLNNDILRRIRRIETQLFNLCLHLGMDPKNGHELRDNTNYDRNLYDEKY